MRRMTYFVFISMSSTHTQSVVYGIQSTHKKELLFAKRTTLCKWSPIPAHFASIHRKWSKSQFFPQSSQCYQFGFDFSLSNPVIIMIIQRYYLWNCIATVTDINTFWNAHCIWFMAIKHLGIFYWYTIVKIEIYDAKIIETERTNFVLFNYQSKTKKKEKRDENEYEQTKHNLHIVFHFLYLDHKIYTSTRSVCSLGVCVPIKLKSCLFDTRFWLSISAYVNKYASV